MKLYKLTDADGYTRRGKTDETKWGEGVTHEALPGNECDKCDGGLCTHHYLHAYTDPLLAALLDPIHGKYGETAKLWEAEGEVAAREGHLKVGCKLLTTIREIDLPQITTEQRVRFGILCALEVCDDEGFVAWARGWLDGTDRSLAAAAWAKLLDLPALAKRACEEVQDEGVQM